MEHLKLGVLLDIDVAEHAQTNARQLTRHVVDSAVVAERTGADGVFLPDRHMRATTLAPNQLVNAAAIASVTTSVDIGSYCSVLPLYNPMEFAEAWAHLDQLSGGRVKVAIGAGYNKDYLRFFGLDREKYRTRYVEAVEIVTSAWRSRQPWSFHGEIFEFEDVELIPGPLQDAGPPLWVAGQGEWAIDFAAANGAGFAGDPFPIQRDLWLSRVARFKKGVEERGGGRAEVALLRHIYVTRSETERQDVLRNVVLPQFQFYEKAGLLKGRLPEGTRLDVQTVEESVLVGSVDYIAQRLAEVAHDFDLTYLIVKLLRHEAFDIARELDMLHAVGEVVFPGVRGHRAD